MLNTINQYNKLKDDRGLVLSYKGSIHAHILTDLLAITEKKLATNAFDAQLKKKVLHILIELIQNLYHNCEENKADQNFVKDVCIILVKKKQSYGVYTGNYMLNSKVKMLKHKLNQVNAMDGDDLRQSYRDRLDKGTITDRGRAGLGLMDMARKSGNQLEYGFTTFNEHYSFFSLKVNVNLNLNE